MSAVPHLHGVLTADEVVASAESIARLQLPTGMIPWFAVPAAILFAIGLYVGFFVAPTDFQQGDAYRIIFIHVPAAWMGMMLYVLMAIYAGLGWAFNARLASMMASSVRLSRALVASSITSIAGS